MIDDLDLELFRLEKLPKPIGLWVSFRNREGEHMGQMYFGEHAHRTSDCLKTPYYMAEDIKTAVCRCHRDGWKYEFLYEDSNQ